MHSIDDICRIILKEKQVIIFDFDGVLVDSLNIKTNAFSELYKSHGISIQEKVIQYQNQNGGINRFDKFKYFHKHFLGKNLTESELNSLSIDFKNLVINKLKKIKINKSLMLILEFIRFKRIPMYCISASPIDELTEILKYKEMSCFFKKIYGGGASKEKNFSILSLEEDVSYSNMVYIGDSKIDLESSRNRKIDFIGYGKEKPVWGRGQLWINNWKDIANVLHTRNA
jgi:phosphoglycolate phosphatase-like HAD superfamily hydrolase